MIALPLPRVTTNSCLNSPVASGAHPVVVFTPGYTATFTDYTFIFEDLASRGYVVASVDHTYEATALEFPDGRLVYSGFGSHLGKKLLEDEQSLTFALSVRLDDLKFVRNELERLSRVSSSLGRVAVAASTFSSTSARVISTFACPPSRPQPAAQLATTARQA